MNRRERQQYLLKCIDEAHIPASRNSVEPHVFVPLRLQSLQGALADFILRIQHGDCPAERIFAALVRSLSEHVTNAVESYRERYYASLDWILLDQRGHGQAMLGGRKFEFSALPLGSAEMVSESPHNGRIVEDHQYFSSFSKSPPKPVGNLFTPNNQWLLKVMLLSGIEERFWGGPALPREFGVKNLAETAEVPKSSVSRFIALGQEHDFISRNGYQLAVKRIPDLLDQWVFHLRNHPDSVTYAHFLYPESESDEQLLRLSGDDLVAGGQLAIRQQELSITNAGRAVFYSRNIPEALEENELIETRKQDAVCEIRHPSAEAAVFKGSVARNDYVLADILQLYLDARLSLARGEEQAEHLFETVLAPFFRRKQWL